MKKIATCALALVLFVGMGAGSAHAQVNYGAYAPQSKEAQIAYLQGVIAQLVAQLEARRGGTVQYYTPTYANPYQYNYQYQYNYNPNPQVLGNYYFSGNGEVDVETGHIRYQDGDITLYGNLDLNRASYANVWFEYGEDRDYDERTDRDRMTRDGDFHIDMDVDEVDDDGEYYYRAVAEDPNGQRSYGAERSFYISHSGGSRSRNNDDDEPEADTDDAEEVEDDEAELHGDVDMNDFNNGLVFFVYGEDEDQVEDVEDEDEYSDIDEDGDDLQKVIVDNDLDDDESYWRRVTGLDDNTDYYFRICVEYEDDDDDETLECGDVEHFETD